MNAQPLKVLLIEDNPADAALVEDCLGDVEGASFHLLWSDRLAVGLRRLAQGDIDVVLLDLALPDSFGLATLDRAVAQAPLAPILVMTGLDDSQVGLDAVRRGACDYLVKGRFSGPDLARALRYAVERRRWDADRERQEAELRLVTEQLPAILWTTDGQLRISSVLGAGLVSLKLRPQDAVGLSLFEFLRTKDSEHVAIAAHRRALEGSSEHFELDWQARWFQVRVEPLRARGGLHVVGTIGIALDVTDQRRVEEDFWAAQKIQQRLLPQCAPKMPGLEIAGVCRPAASTGGDFFDYVPMHGGSLGIVIADVSKHGFAPALIMTSTRRSIRYLAEWQKDLGRILSGVNRAILEDTDPEHFITLFFAQLDPQLRSMIYAGAGHDGYLFHPGGDVSRLPSTALPLGVAEVAIEAHATPLPLEPGNLLLLFTDGLSEAMAGGNGAQFGTKRILEFVRVNRYRPAQEIVDDMVQTVRDHCQPRAPHDDITVVVAKMGMTA